MIVLDTSVLVDALSGPRTSLAALRAVIASSRRILVPSLTFYEWRRGPRDPDDLALQEELIPAADVAPFGVDEATVAARIYRSVPRARAREADIAIASYAILRGAAVWTLNVGDFADLPGIELYSSS